MKMINKILSIFNEYDKAPKNRDWKLIESNILKYINTDQPMKLLSFTCSTINSKYMLDQDNFYKYVSLSPKGNNLESDLPILQEFISKLRRHGMKIQLIILIGNTDPFYIYTQEGTVFPKISKEELLNRFNSRWEKYKLNLTKWINNSYPDLKAQVLSWYSLENFYNKNLKWNFYKLYKETYQNINKYFLQKDFCFELDMLSNSFGENKYFDNLKKPKNKVLLKWVERKFAEYAVQGLWIKLIWPEGILIQNEKPTTLRYKMYQPLIKKYLNSTLPNIYPYGIDNTHYG